MKTISGKELELLMQSGMDRDTPFGYTAVSKTQLSARHSGGAVVNGAKYVYIEYTDELIRDDIYKLLMARRKRKVASTGKQGKLF